MHKQEFIPIAAPLIGEREVEYVNDAVRSTWVSSIGDYIDRFEQGFAEYCGVRHAIAVSSGTGGLHLAIHGPVIGRGDEVIMPFYGNKIITSGEAGWSPRMTATSRSACASSRTTA